jgi:transposase-like protein
VAGGRWTALASVSSKATKGQSERSSFELSLEIIAERNKAGESITALARDYEREEAIGCELQAET